MDSFKQEPADSTPNTPAPTGTVVHLLSDDKLSVTSTYDGPEGTARVRMSWADVDAALAGYPKYLASFDRHLPALVEQIVRERDVHQSLRRCGRFTITVATGPPLWLLPKVRLRDSHGRWELGFGWLYTVVQIRPADRKRPPR